LSQTLQVNSLDKNYTIMNKYVKMHCTTPNQCERSYVNKILYTPTLPIGQKNGRGTYTKPNEMHSSMYLSIKEP
jgi:hypothetical protein